MRSPCLTLPIMLLMKKAKLMIMYLSIIFIQYDELGLQHVAHRLPADNINAMRNVRHMSTSNPRAHQMLWVDLRNTRIFLAHKLSLAQALVQQHV